MTSPSPSSQCTPLYPYVPSSILAGIGVALFALLTLAHLIRMLSNRTWDNIYMLAAGVFEIASHASRIYSSHDPCDKGAYGSQYTLNIMAPTLIMFTVTLTQTSFISKIGASSLVWVPLRLQRRTYLAINAVLASIQLIGSATFVSATKASTAESASKTIVASYVLQMVFWGYLLAENVYVSIKFRRQVKRGFMPEAADCEAAAPFGFKHWGRWNQLFGLAISIIGFGRNLMRLTEFGVAFLQDNEWPSYAFDRYQMVVVMAAWAIWYLPGKCT